MRLEQGNWIEAANFSSSGLNWEIDKKHKYRVSPNILKLKGIIVEDLPELHNSVTLEKNLVDSNGILGA